MVVNPNLTTKPIIPTAGIILAAGLSRRLGHPKQLVQVGERRLIEIVVDAALSSQLDRVILVLGHKHSKIRPHVATKLDTPRFKIVTNPRYKDGLSYSLNAGLRIVEASHTAAMFILGDHPLLNAAAINTLLTAFAHSNKGICQPVRGNERGNPAIFGRKYFDAIKRLKGDTGARKLILSNPNDVLAFATDNPAYFFDIDTQKDIMQLGEAPP